VRAAAPQVSEANLLRQAEKTSLSFRSLKTCGLRRLQFPDSAAGPRPAAVSRPAICHRHSPAESRRFRFQPNLIDYTETALFRKHESALYFVYLFDRFFIRKEIPLMPVKTGGCDFLRDTPYL